MQLIIIVLTLLMVPPANAHAVIAPNSSETGEIETYVITVIGEREVPNTKVVLRIPNDFQIISVETIAGWSYETSSTQITWYGKLGLGESIELRFTAKNPTKEGTYKFTIKQYYADGNITEWNFPGTWVEITPEKQQEVLLPIIIGVMAAALFLFFLTKRKK